MMLLAFAAFPFYLFSLVIRPLLYIGLFLQILYIIMRGLDLGRLPLVGPHDTLVFLSACLIAFSLPFARILKGEDALVKGSTIVALVFTALSLIAKQHSGSLPPVLRTVWFELHVVLAFMAYALFGIGATIGYIFMKRGDTLVEISQYKAILIGYCFFSLSMIFGGIWAFLAWGTYWLWTPKELWTAIVWLFYSLYLHARLTQQWSGRPSAVLGIIGFALVLFTYLGVSLLMKSSHTF